MVYFNNLNDLKKLQSALIEQKRKLDQHSEIENNQNKIDTDEEVLNKTKK